MLKGCQTARERWGGVSEVIDRWLGQRQKLIVLYCSVNGVDCLEEDQRPISVKLQELCQTLIDYVSAGHFDVYEQLLQQAEALSNTDTQDNTELAKGLLPALAQNTSDCLAFNDNCELVSSLSRLQAVMSKLGETMAERFLLEDQMIEFLHGSYQSTEPKIAIN